MWVLLWGIYGVIVGLYKDYYIGICALCDKMTDRELPVETHRCSEKCMSRTDIVATVPVPPSATPDGVAAVEGEATRKT